MRQLTNRFPTANQMEHKSNIGALRVVPIPFDIQPEHAMSDPFETQSDAAFAPSRAPYAIVPNDTEQLALVPKGIYVGTGGDIVLRGIDGTTDVIYRNLPDASFVAVRALYVRATGTTAADLVGEA